MCNVCNVSSVGQSLFDQIIQVILYQPYRRHCPEKLVKVV